MAIYRIKKSPFQVKGAPGDEGHYWQLIGGAPLVM